MVHWNCSSALCFNNYKTVDSNGQEMKHRLPRDKKIQIEYQKFFKTSGFNWKNGYICAAHWSSRERKTPTDLPDVALPRQQYELLKLKYRRAKKTFQSANNPSQKQNLAYKTAKQKLKTAMTVFRSSKTKKTERRQIIKSVTQRIKRQREPSKSQFRRKLNLSSSSIEDLKCKVEKAQKDIDALKTELNDKNEKMLKLEITNLKLTGELEYLHSKNFTYKQLKVRYVTFEYLCGLSVEKFELVMKCVEPYLHLIPYPDCKVSPKSFSFETQFLVTLTVCRHGINLRFMAFILRTSETTVQRIFNGWAIFLATVFNRLDLKPGHGFLLQKMPSIFVDTGHGMTDIIIDATEFKFQCATNFELNSLLFSNYKNTTTGKALIGIAAHGMGILFSDIYPGSISDTDITEKSGALQYVEEEHEIMSDRGFAIQDLCAIKGVYLNRPKQKDLDQFKQSDIQQNFDIASTRIHVERFIGRVRDWSILNNVWPLTRMDLLSSTWQMLCHIVNITMPPIGPKIYK